MKFFYDRLLHIHFFFYLGAETVNFQICHFCGMNVQDLEDHISSFHNFQKSSLEVFDNIKEKTDETVPLNDTFFLNESREPPSGK